MRPPWPLEADHWLLRGKNGKGPGPQSPPGEDGCPSVIVVAVEFVVVEVHVLKVEDVFLDFSRQLGLDVP